MSVFSGFHKKTFSCLPNALFFTVVLAALAALAVLWLWPEKE
jgi:hypothetical protein